LSNIKGIISSEVEQLKVYNQQIENNLKESYLGLHNQLNQTLEQRVSSTKNALNQLHEKLNMNLDNALGEMHGKYLELVNQQHTSTVGTFEGLKRSSEELQNELNSILSNGFDEVQKQLNELTSTLKDESNSLLENISSTNMQKLSEIKSVATGAIDEVKSKSSDNNQLFIETTSGAFTKYNTKFNQSTEPVVEKTKNLSNTLDNLFKIQEETQTASIRTASLMGKNAVLNQITDLISRVKSKVTLLVPEIGLIDTEKILSLSSRVQVTIISYMDEIKDKDWIELMHGASANLQLRSIQKSMGGTLPDFVGCERDAEEIILGTVSDSGEYVAITSFSEYFVKILGNIVIADYSRGKSKQIAK
ncbi:MAG: hypothetical protein OEZ01_13050, partial [Candidatus Heimdallarchaeota archaeon]|nr:hypothetical protein [Candidatus Heimdallarchaeota archaeon]